MPDNSSHSLNSSYREMLLEHLFSGEVMRHVWRSGIKRLEILKPQVDDGGYDLVLEANSIVRHVQLKGTFRGSTVKRFSVNLGLAGKPSGCVIVLLFDKETLELGPFLWFGGKPGSKMPDIKHYRTTNHAKGNAKGKKTARPNMRTVPSYAFEKVSSISEIAELLFGNLPGVINTTNIEPVQQPVRGGITPQTQREIEIAVRQVKAHCSWSMLRKGCSALLEQHVVFTTRKVRASALAFARRATRVTGLNYQQLITWLATTELERN